MGLDDFILDKFVLDEEQTIAQKRLQELREALNKRQSDDVKEARSPQTVQTNTSQNEQAPEEWSSA
jgi:uncharacterized protein YdaU (DUF1376 family)